MVSHCLSDDANPPPYTLSNKPTPFHFAIFRPRRQSVTTRYDAVTGNGPASTPGYALAALLSRHWSFEVHRDDSGPLERARFKMSIIFTSTPLAQGTFIGWRSGHSSLLQGLISTALYPAFRLLFSSTMAHRKEESFVLLWIYSCFSASLFSRLTSIAFAKEAIVPALSCTSCVEIIGLSVWRGVEWA